MYALCDTEHLGGEPRLGDVEPGTRLRETETASPAGDSYCHIEAGDGETFYCGGRVTGPTTCKVYQGEAICPSCGLPTCPSCAVMSDLNARLVDDLP